MWENYRNVSEGRAVCCSGRIGCERNVRIFPKERVLGVVVARVSKEMPNFLLTKKKKARWLQCSQEIYLTVCEKWTRELSKAVTFQEISLLATLTCFR